MKGILNVALLASAAVLVLGTATPGLAQQENMRAAGATEQRVIQPTQAGRVPVVRSEDAAADGYGAYAYQPFGPGMDSCATQGSYGQAIDYSVACGGGD